MQPGARSARAQGEKTALGSEPGQGAPAGDASTAGSNHRRLRGQGQRTLSCPEGCGVSEAIARESPVHSRPVHTEYTGANWLAMVINVEKKDGLYDSGFVCAFIRNETGY